MPHATNRSARISGTRPADEIMPTVPSRAVSFAPFSVAKFTARSAVPPPPTRQLTAPLHCNGRPSAAASELVVTGPAGAGPLDAHAHGSAAAANAVLSCTCNVTCTAVPVPVYRDELTGPACCVCLISLPGFRVSCIVHVYTTNDNMIWAPMITLVMLKVSAWSWRGRTSPSVACLSVRPSICPSVRLSVCPSVRLSTYVRLSGPNGVVRAGCGPPPLCPSARLSSPSGAVRTGRVPPPLCS